MHQSSSILSLRTASTLALLGAALAATPASAENIFGLTATNIVSFDSATPGVITATRTISGLASGDSLLSIDVRPQDGLLYAYSTQNRIYNFTLGTTTAVATSVAGPFTTSTPNMTAGITNPSTGVPSGEVSIDFNPMANALRIEDSADNNYRISFGTFPTFGALNGDGTLRITSPGDFGIATGVAYTNNFTGAPSTSLYVLDATNNALYLQTSPNGGTLAVVGTNVGAGLDIPAAGVGFDISGPSAAAYASFASGGVGAPIFYTVNLGSGVVTPVSAIGTSGGTVTDIAAPVPEPVSALLLLGGATGLLGFRRSRRG